MAIASQFAQSIISVAPENGAGGDPVARADARSIPD